MEYLPYVLYLIIKVILLFYFIYVKFEWYVINAEIRIKKGRNMLNIKDIQVFKIDL